MITKKCRPVLLDTDELPKIGDICKNAIQLFIWTEEHIKQDVINTLVEYRNTKVQHLYLISLDDDNIEVGDKFKWYVLPINQNWITIVTQELIDKYTKYGICYLSNEGCKVIATQEQLSPEYINTFINEYNLKALNDIEIEMEKWYDEEFNDILQPKISSLGHVVIIEYKPTTTVKFPEITLDKRTVNLYSEEEVYNLFKKYIKDCKIGDDINWWNNNKKK